MPKPGKLSRNDAADAPEEEVQVEWLIPETNGS